MKAKNTGAPVWEEILSSTAESDNGVRMEVLGRLGRVIVSFGDSLRTFDARSDDAILLGGWGERHCSAATAAI